MNNAMIEIQVEKFADISQAAVVAMEKAIESDQRVKFKFNDVEVVVRPIDVPDEIVERYRRLYRAAEAEREEKRA